MPTDGAPAVRGIPHLHAHDAPPSPMPPARPRDKVIAAVTALAAAGKLKTWQSDTEVRRAAETWLQSEGCATMPGAGTWKREIPRLRHLWRTNGPPLS